MGWFADGLSYTVDIGQDDTVEDDDEAVSVEEADADSSLSVPDGYFVCSDCGCIVDSLAALRRHQTSAHARNVPTTTRSKKVASVSVSTTATIPAPVLSYSCTVNDCGKVFLSEHGLRNHRQTHQVLFRWIL